VNVVTVGPRFVKLNEPVILGSGSNVNTRLLSR